MLRPSDRKLACDLLVRVPGLHQSGQRVAILGNAGLPDTLLNSLRFQGSAAEFVAELVRCSAERDLLPAVLAAAAEFVGADRGAELRALAGRLTEPSPRTLAGFLDEVALDSDDDSASPYLAIDRLFVPPVQYPRIQRVLAEHHAVIILGDPHVGKTYSAVRLLWELYRDTGRAPRWIGANRLAQAFESPETFRTQVDRLLGRGTAVYLEDPFGTTAPVDLPDFVNNLKVFFRQVRASDVRVVITSRSHVFNRVVPDLFATHVVTLSQELTLGVSYADRDLAVIVTRYLDEYDVAWRSQATAPVVTTIVEQLRAPHNIALFLIDTRRARTAAQALAELPSYRDVVEQFALMIKDLPRWLQGFLCVAYFFSGYRAGGQGRSLFDAALAAGDLGPAELASWDRAGEELATYLTARGSGSTSLRHPSIEDAYDQRVRADAELREVVRRLLSRAAAIDSLEVPAFRCFVHYSDLFWDTPWGRRLFHDMLNADDAYLRETTRLYVIAESRRLPSQQREILHQQAEQEWNDRFLLRLLIGAPVSEGRRARLVARLGSTWDDWIRYQLARSIVFIANSRDARVLLTVLAEDKSSTVARAAVASLSQLR
jgi:hypothetical protein